MEFQPFPKIPRLMRPIIITEKIDGTNAQVIIGEGGEFATASRRRIVVPGDDNFGFSSWAYAHKDELMALGLGRHYGEWWGRGIQRGYGQFERRFSLFNTKRWADNPDLPECCSVVPVLSEWDDFRVSEINLALMKLRHEGSMAAPGYMNPEGIVIYHPQGNVSFKVTLENDGAPKGKAA